MFRKKRCDARVKYRGKSWKPLKSPAIIPAELLSPSKLMLIFNMFSSYVPFVNVEGFGTGNLFIIVRKSLISQFHLLVKFSDENFILLATQPGAGVVTFNAACAAPKYGGVQSLAEF